MQGCSDKLFTSKIHGTSSASHSSVIPQTSKTPARSPMEATMLRLMTVTFFCGTLLTTAAMAQQSTAPSQDTAQLQQVAHFDHQVTGVSVAEDGRIFVNFPRW